MSSSKARLEQEAHAHRRERLARLRGLYAIADDSSRRPPLELVEAALAGGARVVQLRCKRMGAGALLELARACVQRCHTASALLLLNDRPDVALLAGADGVHLGQEDLPVAAARALLGPEALIGLSTHSDAELDGARALGVDYVGFGPVFATRTKGATAPGSLPLPAPHGVEGVRSAVLRIAPLALVAIGGIDAARTEAIAGAGAACVAVIAALGDAEDPRARAGELVAAFERGQRARGLSSGRP